MNTSSLTKNQTATSASSTHHELQSGGLVDRFSAKFILGLLNKLERGCLTLTYAGKEYCFGRTDEHCSIHAYIHVYDPQFFKDVFFRASLGAGESYMAGHWSSPDLTALIRLMAVNLEVINSFDNKRPWYGRIAQEILLKINRLKTMNTVRRAKHNIAAHYDLSNDLFRLFLDPTMMYSSALFPSPDTSLEQASIHKVKRLCDKLELSPTDHLLEIGTGWGFFSIYAASHYGCRVTTTTLSQEQYDHTLQRIKEHGLEDRITVLLQDYRDLTGHYDKLVSVEMIEAVGHHFFDTYFAKCCSLLKDNGLMAIQAITIADQRYEQALDSTDFIQKYIFPGGCLPCNQIITDCLKRKTDMQLHDFEDIGQHYALTLKIWRHNFFEQLEQIKALGFDQRFIRMWEYYLCYCEGGFMERSISAAQFVFAKTQWRSQQSLALHSNH